MRTHGIWLTAALGAGLLAAQPTYTPSMEGWELALEKDSIQVFLHPVAGQDLPEFKAVATFEGEAEEAIRLLQTPDSYAKWMSGGAVTKSWVVKRVDENEQYAYIYLNLPFPIQDRDMVVRVSTAHTSSGFVCAMKAFNELRPANPKTVPVPGFEGVWAIRQEREKVVMIYKGTFKQTHKMPKKLAQKALVRTAYSSMEGIRKQMLRNREAD